MAGGVVALNLLAAGIKGWGWMQAWASLTLILAALPTWQFLQDDEDRLPVFPLIAIIYGIYYGLGAFLPFDPYVKLADVSQASLDRVAFFGMIGVLGMTLGYRLLPSSLRPPDDPPESESGLQSSRTRWLLIMMGLVGVGANLINFLFAIPVSLGALVNIGIQMAFLSIALLFYLQLTEQASVWERWFLWAFLVPSMAMTVFASSLIAPLIRLLALLLLVFIYSKRTFPFRTILVGGLLLFPLLAFKGEYRKLERFSTEGKFGTVADLLDKAKLFTKVVSEAVVQGDAEVVSLGMEGIAQRVDLLYYFSYVTEVSPSMVPYMDGASYRNLPWKIVPRLLYPDKPIEITANEVGHHFGLLDEDDDQTAVNLPQMIELYLNFGPWGIMPGMLVIGLIYRGLKELLLRPGSGPVPSIVVILIFVELVNVESQFAGVFGGLLYSVIIFSVISKVLRS